MLKHIDFDKELTAFIKKRASHNRMSESSYIRGLVVADMYYFESEMNLWLADTISKQNPKLSNKEKMEVMREIRGY